MEINGYKLMADMCKEILEDEKYEKSDDEIKEFENKLRIYNIIADFNGDDKYIAFDSGMFNDIFKGYLELIIYDLDQTYSNYNDENKKQALYQIKDDLENIGGFIFGMYSSKQAEDKYNGDGGQSDGSE